MEIPSEIPCRVSNIAPNGSDPVQKNRLKSVEPGQRSCRSLVGNTEGKIASFSSDPRNDSGLRTLDGATSRHNTPALVNADRS
jgi:hypothetical protein